MVALPKYERELIKRLLDYMDDPYFNIVMLWGPRRSGKTTTILQSHKVPLRGLSIHFHGRVHT